MTGPPMWRFRRMQPGEMNIDPIEGEFFSTEALGSLADALVREAIQNSLDARAPGMQARVRIVFPPPLAMLAGGGKDRYLAGLWPHLATVRALNSAGIERFRAYLGALRSGGHADPPRELLTDASCTGELSAEVQVGTERFATRWGAGEYLWNQLAPLPPEEVEGNRGLWSWLALFYFDQLAPRRAEGTRRPGRDYRHVPDFGFRYRYRHLLFGPFAVYRRHRGHAILILSGPLHVEPSVYQEITSRQDLIASRGVIEALNALYLDRSRGLPKRGAQGSAEHPGTLRRFVRVLQQLDLTYDIYGMPGRALLELLPQEFDAWRGQRSTLF